ncbi:MAG: hypothetical protein JW982_15315 [Spirochaetes bacterium]|nr:hypothetical protein [Spirochaetota bacterium]
MNSVSIISYPSAKKNLLLSMADTQSRYMLPFAGKYRTVDFTLRNISRIKPEKILFFSYHSDDLNSYLQNHPQVMKLPENTVSCIYDEAFSLQFLNETFSQTETKHFIFINGDIPAIADIDKLYDEYKSKKSDSILFQLKINGRQSMLHTVLITNRKTVLNVLKKTSRENNSSPNTFEMLQNMIILKKTTNSSFNGTFWNINTIPEFYHTNFLLCRKNEYNSLIFNDTNLISGFNPENPAHIGRNSSVSNSFISDGCIINGKVEDSIIFPGVVVAEKTIIRNCILLPFVAVNSYCYIENTVIDEFSDFNKTNILFNIGERCRIGRDLMNLKNMQFPKSVYKGLTLIGKNCILPGNQEIGGGCYISSGIDPEYFLKYRTIQNGQAVI